jgi:hypothetical protein
MTEREIAKREKPKAKRPLEGERPGGALKPSVRRKSPWHRLAQGAGVTTA